MKVLCAPVIWKCDGGKEKRLSKERKSAQMKRLFFKEAREAKKKKNLTKKQQQKHKNITNVTKQN